MRREVGKILGHNKFSIGEFADIQFDIFGPALALPLKFDMELACPMEAIDENDNNNLVTTCLAQAGNCSMNVQTVAEIAGGCRSKASVGDKVVLPGNETFTKIKVSAQSDISYNGVAVALGGYGQSTIKFGIRFRAPGVDKVVILGERTVLAPLIWLSRMEGQQDNWVAESTFTGTFNAGSTVTVQVYAESFAIAAVIGLTWSAGYVTNIDSIRVDGSN